MQPRVFDEHEPGFYEEAEYVRGKLDYQCSSIDDKGVATPLPYTLWLRMSLSLL